MRRIRKSKRTYRRRRPRSFKAKLAKKFNRKVKLFKSVGGEVKTYITPIQIFDVAGDSEITF